MVEWFSDAWNAVWAISPFFVGGALGVLVSLASSILRSLAEHRRARLASDEAFRKLDAKKHNEHLKLIGSFCNTLGAAILGAAFIVPYIGQHGAPVDLEWIAAGLALPIAGHVVLIRFPVDRFAMRKSASLKRRAG